MRQIAEDVLRDRYYQPGERGWYDIAGRVSAFIAKDTESATAYFEAMNSLELIPNSPCLMNAGTSNPQLSACFCIPIEDSIESIFDAVKYSALIHKSGGGTGFNFSDIRAKGKEVKGTGHMASGPVSFMHVFNAATETIKQGGKRRGANLGALDVNHPDIKEFITCKNKEGELSNFNISVNITDEWMKNPDPEVWDLIVEGNWKNGEPGILFTDTTERDNKRSDLGPLKYRNPCSEATLLKWESCNLASINLMKCFIDDKFDYEKFYSLVRLGVRFLNDMLDKNRYPLPQIEEATKKTRKIGLGVMGFADVLIALGMRYGDDESLQFANDLFMNMRQVAEHESELIGGNNAALLSLAPTGSISLFAGVSSGIEPNFGYVYNRSTWASGEKTTYREVHPMFEEYLKTHHLAYNDSIIEHASKTGTLKGCPNINAHIIPIFCTAKDIKPRDHVRMQAAIQKHVDQAISKTINCPESTSKDEISSLIRFAWESGCKGLTIYREGSRSDVVLETNATKQIDEKKESPRETIQLPKERDSKTFDCKSACGDIRVTVAYYNDKPIEVFVNAGDTGGCKANIEAIGRLASTAMRSGISYTKIVEQLHKVDCPACKNGNSDGKSCADIIGKHIKLAAERKDMQIEILEKSSRLPDGLKNAIIEGVKTPLFTPDDNDRIASSVDKLFNITNMCPDCGAQLIHIEGCKTCQCGYSHCK